MYYAERRIQDETNIPNDDVKGACANCHAMARPMSWRRSADDWKLLANLHIALYPQADEAFRLGMSAGGFNDDQHHRDPGAPLPVDVAMTFFGKSAAAEHAGVGGLARSHACAEVGGTLDGVGVHPGPRQILWRHGSGSGQRYGRRVHHAREADVDERRVGDFADGPQPGVRRICVARQVEGNAGSERSSRRSGQRNARGDVGIARSIDGGRPLVLGPISRVRLRREDAAGIGRSDFDWRRSHVAEDRVAGDDAFA